MNYIVHMLSFYCELHCTKYAFFLVWDVKYAFFSLIWVTKYYAFSLVQVLYCELFIMLSLYYKLSNTLSFNFKILVLWSQNLAWNLHVSTSTKKDTAFRNCYMSVELVQTLANHNIQSGHSVQNVIFHALGMFILLHWSHRWLTAD